MKHLLLVTFLWVSSLIYANDVVQFNATALETVVAGQQFRVVFSVNQNAKDFRGPDLSDFQVIMGPSRSESSNIEIFNGNVTTTLKIDYIYVLVARNAGEFTIQPAHITVKGQRYASNPLRIKVLTANSNPTNTNTPNSTQQNTTTITSPINDEHIFVRQIISKKSVFEQEPISITYKLYTRYNIREIANAKFPDFQGFFTQEVDLPKDRQFTVENINGINYNTYVLKQYNLYPQRSGNLTLDKAEIDVVLRIANASRSRSYFGMFEPFQDIRKNLRTKSDNIVVKPLPSVGKPSSFQGTVGEFSLQASLSKNEVNVNEALSFKIRFSGNGNMRLLQNPLIQFPPDLEVYDPKITNSISGTSGTREIEYVIIPRFAGQFTIPAVTFTFFNPKTEQYQTITTSKYSLLVDGESSSVATAVVNVPVSLQERVKILGDDIRFISTDLNHLKTKSTYIFYSPLFWGSYIIAMLLFVFAIILLQKQIKENQDVNLVKNKRASKLAKKRLNKANQFIVNNNVDSFYEEISKAVWGYLSDKLSLSNANLLKENIENNLNLLGVDNVTIQRVIALLNTAEFARFSPQHNAFEVMNQAYNEATEIIILLENEIKKDRKN